MVLEWLQVVLAIVIALPCAGLALAVRPWMR